MTAISRKAHAKPPTFLVLPITYKCNARCVMCSIWQKQTDYSDIPLELLERVFTERILAENLTHVNISGGETLLRRDILSILSMVVRLCSKLEVLTVASNGFAPNVLERFFCNAAGIVPRNVLFHISLSLDGPSDTHNLVRGRSYAYRGVMESARRLKRLTEGEPKRTVGFHATLSAYNYAEAATIYELASKEGIYVGFTPALLNTTYISSDKMPRDFLLTGEQKAVLAEFFDWMWRKESRPYYKAVGDMLRTGMARPMSCLARQQGVLLDVDGTVYPCGQSSAAAFGNIYDATFTDIWYSDRAQMIRKAMQPTCDACMTDCYPAA